MLKKRSLQWRLTILSAVVMVSVAVLLTVASSASVDRFFVQEVPQVLFADESSVTVTQATNVTDASIIPDMEAEGMLLYEVQLSLTEASRRFHTGGVVGLVLVTVMGIVATWFMAGWALGPVRDLSAAIQEVGDSDLTRRVDVYDRQDEIGQLAHAFNAMMDKVSASFARQKRFSASAAHELKTPLATIQIHLEVLDLDETPDPERMKKALAVTRTNTDRMIRLTDDLLRLSTDGGNEMEEEIEIGPLFTEILAELSPRIRQKGLAVSASASPSAMLRGNRTLLYRALFNLAENAVKYNRENGTVALEAAETGQAVEIRCSDAGPGIPAAALPNIFEPFYRVERSRSRAMGGSGLGLAIVKDIVERHGGRIEVESTPGEGTTFLLRFPQDGRAAPDTMP